MNKQGPTFPRVWAEALGLNIVLVHDKWLHQIVNVCEWHWKSSLNTEEAKKLSDVSQTWPKNNFNLNLR